MIRRLCTGLTAAAVLGATSVSAAWAASAPSIDGVWRTDGYGTIAVIHGPTLRTYDTTAVSCLPNALTGTATSRSSRSVTFAGTNGAESTFALGAGSDRATWRIDADEGTRHLRRLSGLPARCTRPAPRGPVATFDVCWHTFAENYPFFGRRGVDWQRAYRTYRPMVTSRTNAHQLLAILTDMIRPLRDAHVALAAGEKIVAFQRPGTAVPGPDLDARTVRLVERADLHHPLRTWAQGRIGYADLPGRLGYLRISGFGGYVPQFRYPPNAAVLDRTLDDILTPDRVARLHGLLIDLRVNGGGADPLGIALAARLTDAPFVAYAKQARNDPTDPTRFTTPEPIRVRPAATPRYTGPIALLVGGSDVSAGETFAQAMLRRTPRPVLVGENTQGVFSDTMDRTLPNGWTLSLPNEEYLDGAGRTYDVTGIPPTVRVPTLTPAQFAAGSDPAFGVAATILRGR